MGVPILGGWGGGLTTWEKFPRKVVFFLGGLPKQGLIPMILIKRF